MKRDFVTAIWNSFKTERANLRVIPSIEDQRAFVRDMANRRSKVEGETKNVDKNSDFEGWCPLMRWQRPEFATS